MCSKIKTLNGKKKRSPKNKRSTSRKKRFGHLINNNSETKTNLSAVFGCRRWLLFVRAAKWEALQINQAIEWDEGKGKRKKINWKSSDSLRIYCMDNVHIAVFEIDFVVATSFFRWWLAFVCSIFSVNYFKWKEIERVERVCLLF